MKKLFRILVFLSWSYANAQVALSDKALQRNLDDYNEHYQPEYVEMNFDKDFYFAGNKIWYGLFLTNEAYATGSMSVLAYVELRDKNDSIIIRQKIRCREGIAHGEIQLPEQLPTGYYKITAYTLWMKNRGSGGYFSRRVPVINPDTPLAPGKGSGTVAVNQEILQIEHSGSHSVIIHFQPDTKGELTVFNSEEIVFHKIINTADPIPINFETVNCHHVSIVLKDPGGKLLFEKEIVNTNVATEVSLSLVSGVLSTRSGAELTIDLKDRKGNPVSGNVSVSVRQKNSILGKEIERPSLNRLDSRLIEPQNYLPLKYRREMFIYPPVANTLQLVNFSTRKTIVPDELTFREDQMEKVILAAEMKRKITAAYGVTSFYESENDYNLPYNNFYEPGKYAVIAGLEEFIKEIIPQIKVRKVKGEKVLRVRNSDNSDQIYFFKESPLILVDRFIETTDELLKIPVSDIDRIDIIWGMKEINSLGVFSLADNGVVSVTTKSRTRRAESKDELFKNLHIPLRFSLPGSTSRESAVPLLVDPIYWNPVVYVNGLGKLTFNTSDEPGDFVVEVKGFTESGDYISGTTEFKVSIGTN